METTKEEKELQHWPPSKELEKWLMNTVKDADRGGRLLQQILHMNPAYGAYLTTDENLVEIVQLFAKRFRAIFLASDKPIQPGSLYQPLCEVAWRVIGHVLHCILNLQENEGLPIPNEALGMVKMLLKTNIELSKKFNEMRRAYLRELTAHRDKQRMLSERAQMVVQSLQDHPVMFLEPLDFILDDTTKDFVRQVVEERVKLEMRTVVVNKEEDLETKRINAELEIKLRNAEAEMKQLRTSVAKEMDTRKRLEIMEGRWKEEVQQERQRSELHLEEFQTANGQLPPLRQQLKDRMKELEALRSNMAGSAEDVAGQLARQTQVINDLNQKLAQLQEAKKAEAQELQRLKDELAEANKSLEASQKELEKATEEAGKEQSKLQKEIEALQAKVAKKDEEIQKLKAKKGAPPPVEKEKGEPPPPPVKEKEVKEKVTTKEVIKEVVSTEELDKQRKQHLRIEEELRKANKALEKALEEEKKKNKTVIKTEKPSVDAEIQQAIKRVTEQFGAREQELLEEIKELKEDVAKLRAQLAAEQKKAPKEIVQKVEDQDKLSKWKMKAAELEEERDALQQKVDTLERDMRLLLDKLQEVGGEKAVNEALEQITLAPPPKTKARKKKAYERLYDDAQRRIIEMRMRIEKVQKLEEQALIDAAKRVKDRRTLRQAEMLNHLHKASVATRSRFQDALTTFHERGSALQLPPPSPGRDADGYSPDSRGQQTEGQPEQGQGQRDDAVAHFSWIFDADPEIVIFEIERLKEENQALQAELEQLRRASWGPSGSLGDLAPGFAAAPQFPGPGGGGLRPGASPEQTQAPFQPMGALQNRPSLPQDMAGYAVGSASPTANPNIGRRRSAAPEMPSYPTFSPLRMGSRDQVSKARRAFVTEAQLNRGGSSRPSSRPGSRPGSSPGSRPGSRPGSQPPSRGSSPPQASLGQTISPDSSALLVGMPAPPDTVLPPWRRGSTPDASGAVPPRWDPAMSPLPPGQAAGGVGAEMQPYVPGRVPTTGPRHLSPIRRLSRAGSTSPRKGRSESRSTSPVAFARSAAMEDTGRSRRTSTGRTQESSTPMSRSTATALSRSTPMSRSLPNLTSDGLGPQAHQGPDVYRSQIKYGGPVVKPKKQQVHAHPDHVKPFTDSFVVMPLRSQEHMQTRVPK